MISQMKNQLKKALVSEDDTMNYSYFEGKKADSVEIAELARHCHFLVIIDSLSWTRQALERRVMILLLRH